ncbi:cohesin domain-containing protein [Paenibacillus sp. N3.4]|uniref:cohesin domain-containing protein n=1 Tax=Paenibacillus sp. N3.4 TaxID=2603222 RepID=UPI0011CB6820|nr:cohesin domain-containing protein [Paenibacillus sp. N3.4]TXK80323.1 hypothetical protein FU659_18540 [Paenibacillus sp. N3.4]
MIHVRKLLSCSALVSLLLLLLLPQFVFAVNEASYTLEVSNDKPTVGDQVSVVIKGSNLIDVHAYDLSIAYDASLLKFKESEKANDSGFSTSTPVEQADGHIKFLHAEYGEKPGENGTVSLAKLTFEVMKKGSLSIQLENVKLVNSKNEKTLQEANVSKTIEIRNKAVTGPGGGGGPGPINNNNPDPDKDGKYVVTSEDLNKQAQMVKYLSQFQQIRSKSHFLPTQPNCSDKINLRLKQIN